MPILTGLFFAPAWANEQIQPDAGEQIKWQVLSGGGTAASSVSFRLNGTVGQTAAGQVTGLSNRINQGYWQNFAGCCDKPGDANGDNTVNVGDVVFLINFVFKGGPAPACKDEGDANHDCNVNVGDAVYLINFVFKSGPAPLCGCAGT
jgi:hypothetical protein